MLGSELFLKFSQWSDPSRRNVCQSALDAFQCFQFVHTIKKFLISRRILYHNLSSAVYREHERMAAAAHLLQKLARFSLEVTQRVDVLTYVEHRDPALKLH